MSVTLPFSKAISKTSGLKGNARWASCQQSDFEDANGPDSDSDGTWKRRHTPGRKATSPFTSSRRYPRHRDRLTNRNVRETTLGAMPAGTDTDAATHFGASEPPQAHQTGKRGLLCDEGLTGVRTSRKAPPVLGPQNASVQ